MMYNCMLDGPFTRTQKTSDLGLNIYASVMQVYMFSKKHLVFVPTLSRRANEVCV